MEQRWEVAELPPRVLSVSPGSEPAAAPVEAETAAAAAPTPRVVRAEGYWPWLSAALAAAWLATLALWWRERGRARGAAARGASTNAGSKPSLRKIFRDLNSACAVNDPSAARDALLAYADVQFAPTPPRSLGALAALLPPAVSREVLTLEAHIYGAVAGAWRGDGLKAALGELENPQQSPERATPDPLLPLYR
jgi:hypothetical protein